MSKMHISRRLLGAVIISLATSGAAVAQQVGTPEWTRTHTEAPSHFTSQTPWAHLGGAAPVSPLAQGNQSYTAPTVNAVNSPNAVQSGSARPAQPSTQAVQGRNCTPILHAHQVC